MKMMHIKKCNFINSMIIIKDTIVLKESELTRKEI